MSQKPLYCYLDKFNESSKKYILFDAHKRFSSCWHRWRRKCWLITTEKN